MELFKLLGTIALQGTDQVNRDINTTKQNGEKLATSFNKAADEVAGFGIKLATAVTTATTAIGTLAIKSATEFETSFAKVSTLLDTATIDIDEYQQKILEVSSEMNVSTNELCESIYQAISASVDQADAIDFTVEAMKLAKGGFTDTATAVDIMTTAINAYGMEASDAKSISDKLIMTQNKGKTTVAELAATMGKVIPAANTFGVSLDELCGYYATMTANGIATAESTTYLNSMIKELGTGSDILDYQINEATESILGEKKSFQELTKEGYSVLDIIGLLGKHSENTGRSIIGMFSSSEGGMAAQVLANNIEGVTKNIDAMRNSAGATEEAYQKMEGTTVSAFKKIKNQVTNMFTELGKKLMPTVEKLMNKVVKSLPKIQKLIDKLAPTIQKAFNKLEPVLEWLIDDALPMAVKLLGFCVDNFNTLAIAIGLTFAALKTMSILTTVTTALDASTTAMGAFNAIMAANPIGAVVTALGGLAIALGAYTIASKEDKSVQDERLEQLEEERQAREDNLKAIQDERAAIEERAEASLTEVANTERLWKELQTLCDEEGNVKEADKARADFILNELNEALGTEYTMTGNQIDNYKDLTKAVYDQIEAKKAEIMLSAKEEQYKNAIIGLSDAERDSYNQSITLSKEKKEVSELQRKYDEDLLAYETAMEEFRSANGKAEQERLSKIAIEKQKSMEASKEAYEKEAEELEKIQETYDDTKALLKQYYSDITTYEEASALVLEGKVAEAIDLMDKEGEAYKTAADLAEESAAQQRQTLREQKEDNKNYYEYLKGIYDELPKDQKKAMESSLKEAKQYADKSAEEYENVANKAIEGYVRGITNKQGSLQSKMSDLSKLSVQAAIDASDTTSIGENMVEGISSGIDLKSPSLFSKLRNLMKNSVEAAQDEAEIHSPSRKFADKVGAFIPSGIGMGVEDNEEEAVEPIEKMVNRMASVGNASVNYTFPQLAQASSHTTDASYNATSASYNTADIYNASGIIDKLNQLIEAVTNNGNQRLYLNGDVLVGELAPAMDAALGDISLTNMRGQ